MAYWTIDNDPPPNPTEGDDLDGLKIVQTSTGYDLMDGSFVLATTTKTGPPFEFDNVVYDGETWNVHVASPLPAGGNGSGRWHMHGRSPVDTDPKDGDFTAQAGSGLGEEPGETASYAKA